MASYTKEEFAQMIAQLQDSGHGISNLMKVYKVTYKEAAVIQEDLRLQQEAKRGACIIGEMRKDRSPLEKMTKRAQEAEIELSLIKGINRNEVKELQKRIDHLLNRIDMLEKDLGKRIVTG